MDNFEKVKEICESTIKRYNQFIKEQNKMVYEDLIFELQQIIESYSASLKLYKSKNTIGCYTYRGKARTNLAQLYIYNKQTDDALKLLYEAVDDFCYVKVKDTKKYIEERFYSAEVQYIMARIYQEKDNSKQHLMYLQFVNEDYQTILNIDPKQSDALRSMAFKHYEMAKDYYMHRDKQKAIKFFEDALNYYFRVLELEYLEGTLFDISVTYSRLAETYDGLGDYLNAIKAFKYAINYSKKVLEIDKSDLEVWVNIAIFKSDMAKMYSLLGKEREAIDYYDESIKDSLVALEQEPKNVIILNNIAISYNEKSKLISYKAVKNKDLAGIQKTMELLQTSSAYYSLAYELDKNDNITLINQGYNESQIGTLFVYIKKDEKAVEWFKKSIITFNKSEKIKPSKEAKNALTLTKSKLAQVYNKTKQHDLALNLLQEVSSNMTHDHSNLNHINNSATIQSELGLTYYELSDNTKSIKAFKDSLQIYRLALKINPNNIMVLGNMAKVFSFLLQIENKAEYIEESIKISHKIIELYENDFLNISYEDDALNMTQDMLIPLLELIDVYLLSDKQIDKSLVLAIEKVKAKKLKQLMFNNIMEKSLVLGNGAKEKKIEEIKVKLLTVKKKIQHFNNQEEIESKQKLYDEYQLYTHELSKFFPILQEEKNLKSLLETLEEGEVIIYPIYDGKDLITICVSRKEINIEKEEIEKDLDLMKYINKGEEGLLKALSFIENALVKSIPKNIQKIYFSAFGLLNLLPLHAMTTDRSKSYETYLIENYEISYIPSLSILNHLKKRSPLMVNQKENLFISIDEFQEEAENCQSILGGEAFVEMDLNKCKKLLTNQNHNIVHFSTHGGVDMEQPLNSKILIQEPHVSLTLLDIYGLNFRANLVTLSACRTNVSKVESADEVLAFERAFLVVGANNTLSTFEVVESYSTQRFMKRFYTSLKENNNTLATAFRLAAIESIEIENREWIRFRFTGF